MRVLSRSRIVFALAVLIAAAVTASAQGGAKPLQGTYVVTAEVVPGPGTFTNLIQFDKDGGVRNMAPVPDPPGALSSSGLGQWVRTGPNEFTVHVWFEVVRFDPPGLRLRGFFKQEFKLSYGVDGILRGPFKFGLFDVDDNIVFGGEANVVLKPIS
jgi:hypothetical protein